MSASPSTRPFTFGTLTLPSEVEQKAKVLCATLNLTSTELFCKWEAWALNHTLNNDTPTQADLDQLAIHIREKAVKAEAVISGTTPRSSTKRRTPSSGSVLHAAADIPASVNIDDFFNWVPEMGNTDSTSPRRKLDMDEDGAEDVEMKQPADWANENKNRQNIREDEVEDVDRNIKHDGMLPRKARFGNTAGNGPNNAGLDDNVDHIKLPDDDTRDETYARRAGSGRVEATHSTKVETVAGGSAAMLDESQASGTYVKTQSSSRVSKGSLQCRIAQSLPEDTRYMNDDIGTRVESMRTRVKTAGASILKRIADSRGMDSPPECVPHAFYVASPDVTWALGRIRVDLDDTDGVGAGRINAESVQLESIDGALVKLDLSRLATDKRPVFVAPGAVVVVEGVNVNGRCIDVHAIHDNCVHFVSDLPLASTNAAAGEHQPASEKMDGDDIPSGIAGNGDSIEEEKIDADKEKHKDDTMTKQQPVKLLKIIVAAGPFTTASNLQFEPLEDFLDVVCRERPDVAVLTGPFVDGRHALINEQLPASFDAVFEQRVLRKVMHASKRLGNTCKFIMIPSLDDVHHDFVAPQPAFQWPGSLQGEAMDLNISFVSNPSVIEWTDPEDNSIARVAITSLPAVTDVAADCICWNVDRFHAIAAHLVRQQSMYPVAPPTRNVPLDSTLLSDLGIPTHEDAPSVDLLLCPSRLKAFVRCVDEGVVVVNPGFVCRGSGGGTYADISLPLHRKDVQRSRSYNEENSEINVIRL